MQAGRLRYPECRQDVGAPSPKGLASSELLSLAAVYHRVVKIAVASDHAGFLYKERIKEALGRAGHEVRDFGTHSEQAVDYPIFIRPAAEAVASDSCGRGIILGASGNGEAMCANRVPGVRCAVVWSVESARLARQHNDANMISLGQRLLSLEDAMEFVRIFLEEPFEGGRHEQRIRLLDMK